MNKMFSSSEKSRFGHSAKKGAPMVLHSRENWVINMKRQSKWNTEQKTKQLDSQNNIRMKKFDEGYIYGQDDDI